MPPLASYTVSFGEMGQEAVTGTLARIDMRKIFRQEIVMSFPVRASEADEFMLFSCRPRQSNVEKCKDIALSMDEYL